VEPGSISGQVGVATWIQEDGVGTAVALADSGYAPGEWIGTAASVVLVFVVVAAVVALVVWLFQGARGSLKSTLLNPAVPVTAIVMTVCFELITHR
jgi:hypothetical protein